MRRLALAWLAAVAICAGAFAADVRPAARVAPEWLRGGVVYEIFPRAFSREGTLRGIVPQLERLQALGVTVIWLMPIHPTGKEKQKGTLGSPYAVRDYDAIDPALGTPADFRALVASAHARGMKVFIDVVANHTAWDAEILKKHPEWFTKDATGKIVPPNPDWVDVADLDWSRPGLRDYMTGMMVRWLKDYGVDGFRCDYASGVPTDYWEALRPKLDAVRPGLAFLAESDDPKLLERAFDVDYAWDFYHAMSDALAGRKPASFVRETWVAAAAKYPRGALRLRFSDNHDQLRTTGQAGLPAALAASAVMFTLDGVPLLYNGMELGDTVESAAPALFEDAKIQWEMAERRPQVAPYYRALSSLRRQNPAFTQGEVRWIGNADESRVLSFERSWKGESFVVVANLSSRAYDGTVDAGAGYTDVTPADARLGAKTNATLPAVSLSPWEFRVFRRATP
jgi:cyclomaltodextrinase